MNSFEDTVRSLLRMKPKPHRDASQAEKRDDQSDESSGESSRRIERSKD